MMDSLAASHSVTGLLNLYEKIDFPFDLAPRRKDAKNI